MKISIFTPTHNPKYLQDAYDSLVNQTYSNWEWVILVNGGADYYSVNDMFHNDSRVFVNKSPANLGINIGALKNYCVSLCEGDYVLELDHDDMLDPKALSYIVKKISDTNADFIYSDFCEFRSDGSSNVYGSQYGWNNYEFKTDMLPGDGIYRAMRAQEITPRALYQIHTAPNHVRVWKKSFYDSIGGHDSTMKVCDDHDLLCRTYLAGGKMECIHKPLYLYRLLDNNDNTYLKYNQEIQLTQQEVGNKYFYKLVEKWSDDNQLEKLDFGGAHNPKEGYKSVDLAEGVDIQCDVTQGLPLPDNSVGCIRAYDFFEHISREGYDLSYEEVEINGIEHTAMNPDLIKINPWINLINEMYRILAPGGYVLSATPIGNTTSYMEDPTHVNPLCEESFLRLCNKDKIKYNPELTCSFQDVRVWSYGDYVYADLQALKGQHTVGTTNI